MKRFLSFFIFVFSLSQLSAQLFTHVGGTVGFGQSKILGEKTEFERVKDVQNFSVGFVGEHRFDSPFLQHHNSCIQTSTFFFFCEGLS